jgi:adhesin transport system membrane fusion protein
MKLSFLSTLLRLTEPLKKNIKQIYFLALLQGIFYLSIPLGIQAIVTYTMAGEMSSSLFLLGLLTIIAVIFLGLFQLWQLRINEEIQQRLLADIGVRFSEKFSKLTPKLYEQANIASKINQFFEVLTLQKGLTKILLDFSFSIFSIAIGLIVLSLYSGVFSLFAIMSTVVFFLMIRKYGKDTMEVSLIESKRKYAFVDSLHRLFKGIKNSDNDAPADEDLLIKDTNDALVNYILESNKNYKTLDIQYRSILFFKVIFTACILFVGIYMVQTGQLNIGQFIATEIILVLIINAIEKLVINLKTVYDVITATEKIRQVLELDENEEISVKKQSFISLSDRLKKLVNVYVIAKRIKILVYSIFIIGALTLFMPWNQTVYSEGIVSSLHPTGRTQTIPSRIGGRVEKWFVTEGQFIKKNDTIAFISEIKEDYFDPKLIQRTQEQVTAKESSIVSYQAKVNSINSQIDALNKILNLKLEQTKNKVKQSKVKIQSDSLEYTALAANYKIAEDQLGRYEDLLVKKIISKTEYENRKAKVQDGYSKKEIAENKWINSKNELINAMLDYSSVRQEYNEKLMKSESDKFSVMSSLYDTEANLSKMQNQLTNYSIRSGYYYVTAPQDGYVVKSHVLGIGEIVKEGSPLISFTPSYSNLSVELYIAPMDLPLVYKGMNIQLQFDGWPAFVFSGWPGVSFGTYHAKVVSIDRVISPNGKFRILASPGKQKWPPAIQLGSGVKGMVLLNKVPVFYEIWRKVNGFPPEYYVPKTKKLETSHDTKK